jgi:hypothetical protein
MDAEYVVNFEEKTNKKVERIFVTYPKPSDWSCPLPPEMTSMIFFQSSGTSNTGSDWLSGTFFPTTGMSCHEGEGKNAIFNEYNDHTGLGLGKPKTYNQNITIKFGDGNEEEEEEDEEEKIHTSNKIVPHVHGHIVKMGNYVKKYHSDKNPSTGFMVFYEFIQLHDFLLFLSNKFTNELKKLLDNQELINNYKGFIITKDSSHFYKLFKAITNYFYCEEELKISYQLSDNNEGLWNWTYCNISFRDMCRERWGDLQKINKIRRPNNYYLNVDDLNKYFIEKQANISFADFYNFCTETNQFKLFNSLSELQIAYNENEWQRYMNTILQQANAILRREKKAADLAAAALSAPPVIAPPIVATPVMETPIATPIYIEEPIASHRPSAKASRTKTKIQPDEKSATIAKTARKTDINLRRSARTHKGGKFKTAKRHKKHKKSRKTKKIKKSRKTKKIKKSRKTKK